MSGFRSVRLSHGRDRPKSTIRKPERSGFRMYTVLVSFQSRYPNLGRILIIFTFFRSLFLRSFSDGCKSSWCRQFPFWTIFSDFWTTFETSQVTQMWRHVNRRFTGVQTIHCGRKKTNLRPGREELLLEKNLFWTWLMSVLYYYLLSSPYRLEYQYNKCYKNFR
jgi:hypothetical protein